MESPNLNETPQEPEEVPAPAEEPRKTPEPEEEEADDQESQQPQKSKKRKRKLHRDSGDSGDSAPLDPAKMTMFQLFSNPMNIATGINLMTLMKQPNGMNEIKKRFGDSDGVKRQEGLKENQDVDENDQDQGSGHDDHNLRIGETPKVAEDEGDKIFKEIMSRMAKPTADGQPDDDVGDSTSNRFSMESMVPDYARKLTLFKMHSKKIKELAHNELIKNYESVHSEVKDIFWGKITSFRHNMYNRGKQNEGKLKELALSVPFDGLQASRITEWLFDLLVPDKSQRMDFKEYIQLVSLSETLLRMYSRICQITLELAESEMKFGAYYEESIESLDPNARNQLNSVSASST